MRLTRRGAAVLVVVMACAFVVAVVSFAMQDMWRGSARTLFSVQEHRELLNLARSALAEAYFRLQLDLDLSRAKWMDWCTTTKKLKPEAFEPVRTRAAGGLMSPDPATLQYTTGTVSMERVVGLDRTSSGDQMGIVDLRVTVTVERSSPRHAATLTMVERRNFWLADDKGPYGRGGRHVEVSPTPVMTALEED